MTEPQVKNPAPNLDQKVRLRRLAMSFGSYMLTHILVMFFWYQGLIPTSVMMIRLLLVIAVTGVFFWLIRTDRNLEFKDPSMTAAQMIASYLPELFVMYFLEPGQARAILLFIAMVPPLYGILALNTRKFIVCAGLMIGIYVLLLIALTLFRPSVLDWSLEGIQLAAFIVVMSQIALIGGYFHGLRAKLRKRNNELNEALDTISEMAARDALTGIYNRRHLFEVLNQESNRMRRTSGPFSVCLVDVDFFKQVNDTHGHLAGDEVLRVVATSIQDSLRNIDCVGRYGGEEFLLVLPQTPLSGAQIKAERIREDVANLRFHQVAEGFGVTISVGIAEHHPGEDIDTTIANADKALYQAKDLGRNRVQTYPEGVPDNGNKNESTIE